MTSGFRGSNFSCGHDGNGSTGCYFEQVLMTMQFIVMLRIYTPVSLWIGSLLYLSCYIPVVYPEAVVEVQRFIEADRRTDVVTALTVTRGFHQNAWNLAVIVLLWLGSTSLSSPPCKFHISPNYTLTTILSTYSMWR